MKKTDLRFVEWRCRVCDDDFPPERVSNHVVNARYICPRHRDHMRLCTRCLVALPISAFPDAHLVCKPCEKDRRGAIRMTRCNGCDAEAVYISDRRYNGTYGFLCDQCDRTMKVCGTCGEAKALEAFPRRKLDAKRRSHRCSECSRTRWREKDHPARRKAVAEKRGVDYDDLLAAQGGVCAICGGVNASGVALAIDHDHNTGLARGLLCSNCNMGLGLLADSPDRLRAAAAYLVSHGK